MVLIGLLLIAAILVVLGVVFSSVGLIIGSLVASAFAAGVMFWSYFQMRKGRDTTGAPAFAGTPARRNARHGIDAR